jgi:hypothetical protein
MSKQYFTLVTRDNPSDNWVIEFGAWDRSDVDFERQSYRDHGVKASDLKIIKSDGKQASIDAMVAKLNAKAPEDRGMTTEQFEAHHGRKPEVDDIFAAWRRLPTPRR